jgi:hypothetical protein
MAGFCYLLKILVEKNIRNLLLAGNNTCLSVKASDRLGELLRFQAPGVFRKLPGVHDMRPTTHNIQAFNPKTLTRYLTFAPVIEPAAAIIYEVQQRNTAAQNLRYHQSPRCG